MGIMAPGAGGLLHWKIEVRLLECRRIGGVTARAELVLRLQEHESVFGGMGIMAFETVAACHRLVGHLSGKPRLCLAVAGITDLGLLDFEKPRVRPRMFLMTSQAVAVLNRRMSLVRGMLGLIVSVAIEAEVGGAVGEHLGISRGVWVMTAYAAAPGLYGGMYIRLGHDRLDDIMAPGTKLVAFGHKLDFPAGAETFVARFAAFFRKGDMLVLVDQFGLVRRMGIVAVGAVRSADYVSSMCRLCLLHTGVMAILAELGDRFHEIIALVGAVRQMAGRTLPVFNRLMNISFLDTLGHFGMTAQAKVLANCREHFGHRAAVRVMASRAVAVLDRGMQILGRKLPVKVAMALGAILFLLDFKKPAKP